MAVPNLSYIAAPMVSQSDAPFRMLVRQYGATLAYSQMLDPHKLTDDRDYREFHLRDIQACNAYARPVVVQLCGNDPEVIVKAARQVQTHCDGIGAYIPLRA